VRLDYAVLLAQDLVVELFAEHQAPAGSLATGATGTAI